MRRFQCCVTSSAIAKRKVDTEWDRSKRKGTTTIKSFSTSKARPIDDIFKIAMKTMLLSSLVGICFIEISMLTVGVSMPYHGITGITRRRPLFVGRRQSPSSSYLNAKVTQRFGKQVSPIFLGRRRNAASMGKTKIAPLFLGKKGAPVFLGKRSTPMFVGKKTVPLLQGKRSETPMFVGKKSYLESDLITNEVRS